MKRPALIIFPVSLAVLLSACAEPANAPATPVPAAAAPASPATPPTDAWIGDWTGPEGTGLRVAGGGGSYTLTIRNLDGPRDFPGRADGASIRFARDGVEEFLRAGDGDATGMKWLAGKSECLLVRAGEGWCRR